ncbi:hypothetical protein BYT27DRAFT_7243853 [Phlegmacium glaucopus]|nr:hypothetical protein BYT27DRAFT_7243853 [Phlegmacium glaucopus]
MLCDKCLSPVDWNLSPGKLGTDTSESVASLEGEIELIETMMAQFAQRCAFLRRRINGLSPTARIPPEILTEIFQIACQPIDNGHKQAVTPLFIGSICRLWRDIAWSTPLLWNTILLHVSPQRHGAQVQLLVDWLSKAKSTPLSIKLVAEDEYESIVCAFPAIMRVLVTRSDYWRTFDSLLPPQCHHLFKNVNFPMLTSVSVHPSKSTISTFNTPPDMFLTAPKLLGVDLSGYNFAAMVLPWGQLRSFRTQLLTVTECLKVLRQSPNLEECHLEHIYSPDSFASKTIMLHTRLKRLDVILIKAASMSLFDSITLPSLSHLRIHYSGPEKLLLSPITSLVLRSACNLERLTVEKYQFEDADLISCLEAIPSITYLHLEMLGFANPDMGLTRHFVTSLNAWSNSKQFLLPNLKCFKYKGRVLCDCRTIVDMLARRWHSYDYGTSQNISSVSQLKLAEVLSTIRYHVTADVQEELSKLSENGMLVRVESLVPTADCTLGTITHKVVLF